MRAFGISQFETLKAPSFMCLTFYEPLSHFKWLLLRAFYLPYNL